MLEKSKLDLVLTASQKLLAQKGYGGLTLSAIANEAGVDRQLVYYHFKQLDKVVIILTERWDESGVNHTVQALAENDDSGALKVVGMAQGIFQWLRKDPEICKMGFALFQAAAEIPRVQQIMEDGASTGRNRIRSFLIRDPKVKKMSEAKLEILVDSIHLHLYGAYFYAISLNAWDRLDSLEAECIRSLQLILSPYLSQK